MNRQNKSNALSTTRMDKKLLEAVKGHPVLYDPLNIKYMDGAYKDFLWKEIAKKLNSSSSVCKSRWYNIRDQYRKSLIRCATQSDKSRRKYYKYTKELSFLRPYYNFNYNILDEKSEEEDEEESKEECVVQELDPADKCEPEEHSVSHNRTELSDLNITAGSLMEFITKKFNIVNKHPVDAFLAGLAPVLKSLPPLWLNRAKSEIFEIVQRYEMKMFADEQSATDNCNDIVAIKKESNCDPLTP